MIHEIGLYNKTVECKSYVNFFVHFDNIKRPSGRTAFQSLCFAEGEGIIIVFCRDVRVAKNTSQTASVRAQRVRRSSLLLKKVTQLLF